MNTTYTLTEGNDALNRVLLMMQYELGKTLDEQKIPTDKDLKKYQQDKLYNNTQKFVDNTAVSLRGPDGRRMSTGTSPKMLKGIQRFEAPTLSEGLLMTRELLFTPGGMTVQIVLSILGAEIGLPIVFELLDIAIIINDFSIMVKNWKTYNGDIVGKGSELKPWSWEWFQFHWGNNKGFQLVIEDIAILLTMGLGKLIGKGAKSVWRYFKPIAKDAEQMMITIEQSIVKKESFIKKLPKKISSFCEGKINELKKGIELLKTPKQAAKSVVRQLGKATFAGGVTYALSKYLEVKIPKWTGAYNETILHILIDNPWIYNKVMKHQEKSPWGDIYNYVRNPNGVFYVYDDISKKYINVTNPNQIKSLNNMFITQVYPKIKFDDFEIDNSDKENPIYTINGVDYKLVDDTSLKLKKIN